MEYCRESPKARAGLPDVTPVSLSGRTITGQAGESAADQPGLLRRPLDILIVTSEAPPVISGISTCVRRLATGLTALQHRVRILSAAEIGRLAVGEWRLSPFLAYWPFVARKLRYFDVVNLHGPVPMVSDVFLRLASLLPAHSRPAIVYTHHSAIDLHSVPLMSSWYTKLHESLALRADRIVTSSQHYASSHYRRYGPLVQTIPWGADEPVPVPRRGERPDPGGLRVLFVGQMRPYKGVETLLAAAAGQPWLKLTLVGGGPGLERYQRLARQLSAANARFTGRLQDAELRAQYMGHDVVVLPSVTRAEAFGLTLLEGMAAGCVPVASDLPGVRDVAAPTGLVVPPGDPGALRAALRGLATDHARLTSMQAASLRRAGTLTWERCVAAYEQVMQDAVQCRYTRLHGHAARPGMCMTEPPRAAARAGAGPERHAERPAPAPVLVAEGATGGDGSR